jgi:hypothetical protein
MNPNEAHPIHLERLHENICAHLALAVPVLQTIKADYDITHIDEWELLPMPALFIEMNEAQPSDDQSGTEQLRMMLDFEFRLVMNAAPSAGMKCRSLALQVAKALHLNQFDQPIKGFEVTAIADERYRNNDGLRYHIMLITATTEVTLGLDVWEKESDQHIAILKAVYGDDEIEVHPNE